MLQHLLLEQQLFARVCSRQSLDGEGSGVPRELELLERQPGSNPGAALYTEGLSSSVKATPHTSITMLRTHGLRLTATGP
jgi:hypothetical protein